MSAKLKAIDDIKKFSKMFSGIIELGVELEKVASIEQAGAEAKNRSDAAIAESKVQEEKLSVLQSQVDECANSAKAIVLEAKALAKEIQDQAVASANEKLEAAEDSSKQMIAATMTAKANLANEMESHRIELAKLKAEIIEKSSELVKIKSALSEIKSKLG